ncbi:nuclear receptor coactivator 7 isoform X2 [Lampris incognitus]|uniref:nuclear receptor coactivator 7 isoform X2 n=1 Tax=Lampris incognitus TaxID=2546036 RepID=UPI0024B496B0|nr:nuclear receptor coactivator 7 isoform X2 [Lampris incognitus]
MAQSVKKQDTLGAMEQNRQRDKSRTSYFGNVKNRLGAKLPAGVTQPPQFTKDPWEKQLPAQVVRHTTDSSGHHQQHAAGRPLDHVPHIRNPKLRQYYLQGTSWELNTAVMEEETSGLQQTTNSKHLCVPEGKKTPNPQELSLPQVNLFTDVKQKHQPKLEAGTGLSTTLPARPLSPSPDAEYDKLLDVEAVPMPDGQLCLLALPPECSQGEGPEATPYLKLVCRYITDRKGVVSGILLVTSNKIFFDPCKTHPLVMEHGCEEYLLSCSVDCLASVSFFADITHIHFVSSQYRWTGRKSVQKSKTVKNLHGGFSDHKDEADPSLATSFSSALQSSLALGLNRDVSEDEWLDSNDMAEAERQMRDSPLDELVEQSTGALGVAVLSSAATFCCGGQDVGGKVKTEPLPTDEAEKESYVKYQLAVPHRPSSASPGGLMFVRLRFQRPAGKKKGVGGLHLGTAKTLPRRDAWLALSQESADELYAYLSQWRPDLCILQGGEEGEEGEGEEEEFVLIEDREEEVEGDEEVLQKHRRSGEDWEMVSMEESGGKLTLVIDRDPECLDDIVQESRILEASYVRQLCMELPPRLVGSTWKLAYSTSRHGFSLKCLYRKLSDTDSPVLIVIKDALDQEFGSFLSHPLRPSDTFYGTGETFLFMLHPRFKCFRWSGENSFFIKGDLDSFAIGGGSGHFGLWLDEMLYLGRSTPCHTFNNCCLSETDDFRVIELEVWTFR